MPFESYCAVPYFPFIVTMAILYRLRDFVENREIFIPPRQKFARMFDIHNTRMTGLPCGEKTITIALSRLHRISQRIGQTDRQTDKHNCYIIVARQCAR